MHHVSNFRLEKISTALYSVSQYTFHCRSTKAFIARVYSSICFLLDQAEPGAPKSFLALPVVVEVLLLFAAVEPAACARDAENEIEFGAIVDWLWEGISAGGESGASIMGESAESWKEELVWSLLRCAI